ncbi:hypothetical protein DKE52_006290 [Acinetobacter pittii]|uniref:Uncharacterized protein n=1 Tax=Acinetobacter pittii TaxID=48296 RepID=A0A3G6YIU6_ACIPI|nr:hypothetical protein DKE52_006290 [Acinetobacter pittii]
MNKQSTNSDMQSICLELIEQNNQLIKQMAQTLNLVTTVITQNNQLIQLNTEQSAQINYLLDELDLDDKKSDRDLDDE